MPRERDVGAAGNGENGKDVGLLERLKSILQEDVQSFRTDLPAKAKELIEGLVQWSCTE